MVGNHYGFVPVGPPIPAESGHTNSVVLFDDVVLRLQDSKKHQHLTEDYLDIELQVLQALREKGFTLAPQIRLTLQSKPYFQWSQGFGVLFDRFVGKMVTPGQAVHVRGVATVLGTVHRLLYDLFPPKQKQKIRQTKKLKEDISYEGIVSHATKILQIVEDKKPLGVNETQEWVDIFNNLLGLAKTIKSEVQDSDTTQPMTPDFDFEDGLPVGVIHLDLNHTNWLWDQNDSVVALLDWDFVNIGLGIVLRLI